MQLKKGTTIGLVAVLVALSFLAGFFVHFQLDSEPANRMDTSEAAKLKKDLLAAQQEVNDFALENRPKLWLDYDAANLIRQRFEYSHVWFLRWHNGVLEGWVEFDGANGPERSRLDFHRPILDQWAKEGRRPVARGSRGDVLLALRQIGKTDEFDCELYASFMLQSLGGGGGGGSGFYGKHKVRLEPDPKFENTMRFGLFPQRPIYSEPFEISLNRFVDKKPAPWLDVKLVDLPK